MCNGSSNRVSQGGSIAVMRPTSHLARTHSEQEIFLLFTNPLSKSGTSVECQGLDNVIQQNSHWLVIHRDGDLSAPQPQSIADSLYSFEIGSPLGGMMHLPEKLHLGVGDNGIIGRRVSVMTGSTQQPLTLAEGVVGWN
ncbi:hypothetical protein CUC08_Gglean002395 [Alternaria sp. MG1]|nr:hypothetical protein CUC08_Gglean002395 [Alternaria sp. MG1]